MRTNIVLNDDLVKEAFHYTPAKTKRELVEIALREFIENHRRKDMRKLRGKVKISAHYDHKKLRNDKE